MYEFIGDLGEFKNLELLVKETVKHFGGIDILVNNAGFGDTKTISEVGLYTLSEINHTHKKI